MRGGDLGARLVGMAMALAAVVAFITVTFVVIAPAGRGGDDASAARRRLARRTGATTREEPPAPPQPPLTILPPPGGGTAAGSTAATVGNAVFISHEPRAVVYPEFLSREECEGLIALARPRLKASRVVLPPNAAGGDGGGTASGDNSSSNSIIDNATALGLARGSSLGQASVRTSSGAFLNQELRDHPLVRRIDDRIATLVALPQSNGESLHVIRYQQKELYKPHFDYFKDENLDRENPNP